MTLEPRFADDSQCYVEFQVHGCGPIYLDEDHAPIVLPIWGEQVVMMDDGYTVALYPGGMEYGVTYSVVIANGDFQDGSGLNFTGPLSERIPSGPFEWCRFLDLSEARSRLC